MTSLIHLCLVLFIVAFARGYASSDDAPEDTEFAYSDSPSTELTGNPRFRRDAAPPQGKKKDSLFQRIMQRAMQIKHNHNNKPTSRRSTYRRSTYRRSSYRRSYPRTSSRTYRRTYSRPPTYRRPTYRRPAYRRPDYRKRYVPRTRSRSRNKVISPVRRVPTKSTSKSKQSLFHRILNRVQTIRDDHGKKRVPTRKVRPSSTRRWSSKRKVIEKKTTKNVPKKNTRIFDSILKRFNEIKNNHKTTSRWSSKRKVVEEKPTRSWSSKRKVVEEKPTRSWSSKRKVVEEKPTRSWSSKRKVVEEKPTRSWSSKPKVVERKPVEEKRTGSWSSKRKPEGKSPIKVIQPTPKGKPSLFHSIINRVTQIRNNHRHKGVVIKIPSKSTKSVVAGAAGGLLAAGVLGKLKDVYSADNERTMKTASWNVFERKASRRVLDMGRAEICAKLKLMKLTVFGLQGAIYDQIDAIRRCLPANQYTYYRGQGRYDKNMRKYRYNPIFYEYRNRNFRNQGSGSILLRNSNNRLVPVATYVKLRFSKNGRRVSNSGVESEVLIVNININGRSSAESTKHLKNVLDKVQKLSSKGRSPVILMGDFKQNEKNLQSILDLNAYQYTVFHNTLNKRFNPNAYTPEKRDISNNVYDYILEHNLNTIFAATITDSLKMQSYTPASQKPIFAAFKMP